MEGLQVLVNFMWGVVKVEKDQGFVCGKDGGYKWDVWFQEGWGEVLHLKVYLLVIMGLFGVQCGF